MVAAHSSLDMVAELLRVLHIKPVVIQDRLPEFDPQSLVKSGKNVPSVVV